MRATILGLGALLGLAAGAPAARAQCPCPVIPRAPDACGPCYYQANYYGLIYGPNYQIRPPYPPFQGMVPAPPKPCGPCGPGAAFPTHPWARSPRDFFMLD